MISNRAESPPASAARASKRAQTAPDPPPPEGADPAVPEGAPPVSESGSYDTTPDGWSRAAPEFGGRGGVAAAGP